MDSNLVRGPAGRTLTAAQPRVDQRSNRVDVNERPAQAESTLDQPPLYASGIAWIDRAYNLIRQLRRDHGLPDIRPLVEPPFQSNSAAIATSPDGRSPVRRQPPEHRKVSSIHPE